MKNPLQEYREKKGITIQELANQVNLTPQYLATFLNDHEKAMNPTALTLWNIHQATKIPYAKLIEHCMSFMEDESNPLDKKEAV